MILEDSPRGNDGHWHSDITRIVRKRIKVLVGGTPTKAIRFNIHIGRNTGNPFIADVQSESQRTCGGVKHAAHVSLHVLKPLRAAAPRKNGLV